ncbi:NADP-dependent oxidoreductase [Actinophytocola oryzae]|uniref:NADPH2:quinone reductase n=1 Tax=Actinophytocola oryzae TaxID=502181 RepID=A0A4R7VIA9_9PSEU|nr:NADP-dependent oxidoreductase [Actinophytocola oryzae]TDV48818.1 NADPH2:quinone reductase [Actinophytocola oryzae]
MKAVVATRYGPPEVLSVEDVPVPRPGPGQIQVRVRAAAVNPADLRTLSGVVGELSPLTFPHVPGSDFAGTVSEVGPDVTRFVVGDEVFGVGLPRAAAAMATMVSSPVSLTTGAMAEYAVFEADTPALAPRPDGVGADHAATLPIPGLTALAVLRDGGFAAGQRVLVTGAAGGVGGAVVPLLAETGVHVIATALPEDDDYVRGLGATEVIDYRAADTVTETLRRHPGGVDAMVNLTLPGPALVGAARAIRSGGRLLNIAFPSPDAAAFDRADLTVRTVYSTAQPGDLEHLAARAVAGTLPSTVSRRYTLDEGAQAYRDLVHTHVRGKPLVVVSGMLV